ncbi:MerR family transcriptional regulator [Wolbachia pipientis]|uniref:MerR family transcriptional regulator n=1 Tax=Wolbachia pipientis TaxID=955 RepID=A0A1E7QJY9_WOLPI|nr:MerR family transcriptional regulator [Wolbachia pipientis]OEY86539.1 MerR family transcriptional regulator [Wolbachia pipientis]
MNKEKLLFTIGEVARQLSLEQHVLRFWESQFGQIKPVKCKSRRLYDRKCIETIKTIKHMLYDKGYTIKGAQKELKNNKELEDNSRSLLKEIRDWLITQINE